MADKFIEELDSAASVVKTDLLVVEKADGSGTKKAPVSMVTGAFRRVRLGVFDITASRTLTPTDLYNQDFLGSEDLDDIEIDIECVGGGGAGGSSYTASTDGTQGGCGGGVTRRYGVPLRSITGNLSITIGAGVTSGQGGTTSVSWTSPSFFVMRAYGGYGAYTDEFVRFIRNASYVGVNSGYCSKGQASDTTIIQGRDGPGAGGCHGNGLGGSSYAPGSTVFDAYGSGGAGNAAGNVPGGGSGGADSNAGQTVKSSGRGQVRIGFFKWVRI